MSTTRTKVGVTWVVVLGAVLGGCSSSSTTSTAATDAASADDASASEAAVDAGSGVASDAAADSTSRDATGTSTGEGGTGGSPSGTVVSVGTDSFVLKDASGTDITIDTVSGSTYQVTTTSTASEAAVGGWVAGLGTVTGGALAAVDLAFVPTPPSFIAQSDVETTPGGTLYFGQITAVADGVLTITTTAGSEEIRTATATAITLTQSSSFSAIAVGDTVEVNGPEVSATEYTGHQINLGPTPAVVGQFD